MTFNELYHHGILGMKWGKRNGPPYPLNSSQKSAAEKKKQRQVAKYNENSYNNSVKKYKKDAEARVGKRNAKYLIRERERIKNEYDRIDAHYNKLRNASIKKAKEAELRQDIDAYVTNVIDAIEHSKDGIMSSFLFFAEDSRLFNMNADELSDDKKRKAKIIVQNMLGNYKDSTMRLQFDRANTSGYTWNGPEIVMESYRRAFNEVANYMGVNPNEIYKSIGVDPTKIVNRTGF